MYSTDYVAQILEVDKRTIINYINKGHLKATKTSGQYLISYSDLTAFENEFFYTEKRFENKSKGRKLSKEEFENLNSFVEIVQSGITLEELVTKYEKLELKLPSLEAFLRFKRNESIKEDRASGSTYADLCSTYNLSEKSIENILKEKDYNTIKKGYTV